MNRIKPSYYMLPNGIECFDVVRHFNYNRGTAIAYIWRSEKNVEDGLTPRQKAIEDLQKAVVHLNNEIRELQRLEQEKEDMQHE